VVFGETAVARAGDEVTAAVAGEMIIYLADRTITQKGKLIYDF